MKYIVLASLLCLPVVSNAHVVIDSTTTILIDRAEPEPLQKAAADLARDFRSVFGKPARVVHDPREVGMTTIWIGLEHGVPQAVRRPTGWETLHIQAVHPAAPISAALNRVVLTGSDVRGAIYAVYEFSRRFLGVDPLYWWTDHAPRHQRAIDVPDDFSLTEGPTFRYRGWFVNDEDLLTGWAPGAADGTGIALKTWDHIFEAILRLKGDLIVPGTFIFPDEAQIRAASERGLVVTQNHVNTLGLNTRRWPQDKPMSYLSDHEALRAAWTHAVEQYPKDAEVLWMVGFRGKSDRPFWFDDPTAPASDRDRAEVIRKAIDEQMEIVRRERPKSEFFLNTWVETADLLQRGLLQAPNGVTLIWADAGFGILKDGNALAQGQGEYYHTAVFWPNHYAEMVPIERIQRELGRAARVGATRLLLINTGNIRPVPMSTRAAMELAWQPGKWTEPNADASREYLERWSREEFGERAVRPLVNYYEAYFSAPARFGHSEQAVASDGFYPLVARQMVLGSLNFNDDWSKDWGWGPDWPGLNVKTLPEFIHFVQEACRAADARWQQVRRLANQAKPLVSKSRLDFFQAHVLTQVDLHLHFNRMLMNLTEAIQATDVAQKVRKLNAAIAEADAGAQALHAAEYGRWSGYYTTGDWLLDAHALVALLKAYSNSLQGHPMDTQFAQSQQFMNLFDAAYARIGAYQGQKTVAF